MEEPNCKRILQCRSPPHAKMMQLFVKYQCETHLIRVTTETSYGSFMKLAQISDSAMLTLNGREIGQDSWADVRAYDTLDVKQGPLLLGGSKEPLLATSPPRNRNRASLATSPTRNRANSKDSYSRQRTNVLQASSGPSKVKFALSQTMQPQQNDDEFEVHDLAQFSASQTLRASKKVFGESASPGENRNLWRKMSTAQLAACVFTNTGKSCANQSLLRHCSQDQIAALLKVLPEKKRKFVEAAQMHLLLSPIEIKGKQVTLENLQELDDKEQSFDIKGLDNDNFFWLYRPGTDGQQIMVIDQYKGSVPCHTLQEDGSWSDPVDRTHHLKIYNMSEDRKYWDQESTTNLSFDGRIIHGLRPFRPFFKDVAFLTIDVKNKKLSVNIIPDGQKQVTTTQIPTTSELHEFMMENNETEQHQFFRDRSQRDMVVFSRWWGGYHKLSFYDIALERTIIAVNGVGHLLYMCPQEDNFAEGEWCIFEKYGCIIDFTAARSQSDAVEINPAELIQQNNKNIFKQEVICDEQWEMRDWSRNGKQGFSTWFGRTSLNKIVEVQSKSPQKMNLVDTLEKAEGSHWFWQGGLQTWISEKSFDTKPRYESMPEQQEFVHDIFIMNKDAQQTIFVGQPLTKQFVGLTFQGQVISFAVPQILLCSEDNKRQNEKEPHFTVITEDRKRNECHLIKFEYQQDSENLSRSSILDYKITKKDACQKYREELIKIGNQKHLIRWESWDGTECLWLQTKTFFKWLWRDSVRTWHEDGEQYKLRPIPTFSILRCFYVATDTYERKDILVYITDRHNVLLEVLSAQVLKLHYVDDVLYILDTDYNLRRYGIMKGDNHSPKVKWSTSCTLGHIQEIKTAIPQQLEKMCLTSTTLSFMDKVISLETGSVLFNGETFDKKRHRAEKKLAEKQEKMEEDSKQENSQKKQGMVQDAGGSAQEKKAMQSERGHVNVVLLSNMMLYQAGSRLNFLSNPGSRSLRSISLPFLKFTRKLYQVSAKLMLIQRGAIEWDWTEWVLIGTDGTLHKLSSNLEHDLLSSCEQQTYFDLYGNCQLLLCNKSDEENNNCLKSAKIIQLTEAGEIVEEEQLELTAAVEGRKIAKEVIMVNYQGDLLQLRVNQYSDENVAMPRFIFNKNNVGKLKHIDFDNANKKTHMAYVGHFFCWIAQNQLHALDLETKVKKTISLALYIGRDQEFISIKQSKLDEKTFSFKDLELVSLDACKPKSLVEAGWLGKVDKLGVKALANHVQVTVGDKARFYNLQPETIIVVDEIDGMSGLLDAHQFIETGFQLMSLTKESGKRSLRPSPMKNLLIEMIEERFLNVYRRYTSSDIEATISMKSESSKIHTSALWASFEEQTLLSFIADDFEQLSEVYDYLASQEFANVDQDAIEDPKSTNSAVPDLWGKQVRRIKFMLEKRTLAFDEKEGMLRAESLLSKVLDDPTYRDAYLKIGRLSNYFNLSRTFDDQQSLKRITSSVSAAVTDSLIQSFEQTHSMQSIKMLDWPTDYKEIYFMSPTLEVTETMLKSEIEKRMEKDKSKWGSKDDKTKSNLKRPVIVEMINLKWFYEGGDETQALSILLSNLPTRFFSSRFIIIMIGQFWSSTKKVIVRYQFVPFVILVVLAITYFHRSLSYEAEDEMNAGDWSGNRIANKIIGGCTIPLLLLSLESERKQIQEYGYRDYFGFVNTLDLLGLLTTTTIIVLSLFDIEWLSFQSLRMLASISCCSLIIKFYDWLRVFEVFSFYISLMENTICDIVYFLVLFVINLAAFGVPMSMLDLNQRSEDDIQIVSTTGFWLFDAIFNQYLLSLGEFDVPSKEKSSYEKLFLLFFASATFFTMITMLNMLIAIMGDSFDQATEESEKLSATARLKILTAQVPSLPTSQHTTNKVYMIIVRPEDEAEDEFAEESWAGRISKISSMTAKQIRKLEQQMQKSLKDQQSAILGAVTMESKSGQAKIEDLDKKISAVETQVEEKVSAVKVTVDEIKELLVQLNAAK